jgi:Ca-activated chloride channel homolog
MALFLAHIYWCIAGFVCIVLVALWRFYCYHEPCYVFSSLQPSLVASALVPSYKHVFFVLRTLALLSLMLALGRLQAPDSTTQLPVQGIDIMLLFDVSDSMQLVDDQHDQRSRIQIACDQACSFVDKRPHDAFALVLFGREVVSRCPCTQDKQLIKELLQESTQGVLDGRGTMLGKALLTGVNRLQDSRAHSKIIIALTDGRPTAGDIDHRIALELAQKFQIKIYTIGIGFDASTQVMQQFGFFVPPELTLNTELLQEIATSTGGQFFLAKNPHDMKLIYEHIDALEKHEQRTPLFTRYTDYFMPFLLGAFACSALEIVLAIVWRLGL